MLQCGASLGTASMVMPNTRSIASRFRTLGRPGRGLSSSPSIPPASYRRIHLYAVLRATFCTKNKTIIRTLPYFPHGSPTVFSALRFPHAATSLVDPSSALPTRWGMRIPPRAIFTLSRIPPPVQNLPNRLRRSALNCDAACRRRFHALVKDSTQQRRRVLLLNPAPNRPKARRMRMHSLSQNTHQSVKPSIRPTTSRNQLNLG